MPTLLEKSNKVESMSRINPPPPWWSAADLDYVSGKLCFGNRTLEEIAAAGTPVYVLRPQRAADNLSLLKNAAPDIAVCYAIKANRHPLVVDRLRRAGIDGIDVCSPAEVQLALSLGIPATQISYTGTSVSNSDLDFLTSVPGLHINVDSLCAMRRLLERTKAGGKQTCPKIGLRINPEMGLGYRQEKRLTYSGADEMSKFGILFEQIPEAIQLAKNFGAVITTLHWHVGCGWLSEQLSEMEAVLARGLQFAECFPDVERVNLGGGLGVPLAADDKPVDLVRWYEIIQRQVRGRYKVQIEPGAFLVQNSTVLLVEVCTVEQKRGTWFVGINSGFNLLIEPVFYGMPSEVVPLVLPKEDRPIVPCRFAGNINEAHDMLPQYLEMALPREGDFFALLNAGAYGTSMASSHCLRGCSREIVVD